MLEFVLELANCEEYLYSKFEKDLSLEIKEKMSIIGTQNYKKVVQLFWSVEKLTGERINHYLKLLNDCPLLGEVE